jgi:hypothetical protein
MKMTASALTTGTILEGRYALLDQLGQGGMACVYRARDQRLDRLVAVKVLDTTPLQDGAAFREDQLTARLDHPHIVSIYDSGTTPDGRPFLVMELTSGASVDRQAPLPIPQALAIAAAIADAVAHAHRQGIVHCDIKPDNVLLDAYGRAKLTDFGIARPDAAPVQETVYGAAAYLAPERLRGAPVSPAVDIYGLGALLYFLIAGRPPYVGATSGEIIARVQAGPPAPLATLIPALPPTVDTIVRRALAHDPADRYPTAMALHEALEAAQRAIAERATSRQPAIDPIMATAPLPEVVTRVLVADPAAPRGRSRWLLATLVVLVAAFLALALARAYTQSRSSGQGGADVADVPSLQGLTLTQAREELRTRGLTVGRVDTARLPGQPASVAVYQDPPAGARVKPGTAINFVLRVAP